MFWKPFLIINEIKKIQKENIKFTKHAIEKIIDRNLNETIIKETILNNKILSIIFQEENKKKILFKFNKKHNLVIVLKNTKENLKIITIHKIHKERKISK